MDASAKSNGVENMRVNDIILTTKELDQWLKDEEVDFNALEVAKFDNILGFGIGAGIINLLKYARRIF